MKGCLVVWVACCLWLWFGTASQSAVPHTISYQGKLTDSLGTPLPDGSYDFSFTIYDAAEGGNALWSSTIPGVEVSAGLFSCALGSVTSVNSEIFPSDDGRWLGISVSGIAENLMPRSRLMAVPYAFRAEKCDTAEVAVNALGESGWMVASGAVTLIDDTDSVGIGTSNPIRKLDVRGEARFEGVRLPNSFGPDSQYFAGAGNYICFGHPNISEDFIGYRDNRFYFMDSPGGADESDPHVTIGGDLDVNGSALTLNGPDFNIREISNGSGGRAMVHAPSNALIINYSNDFTGGVRISGSQLDVDGALVIHGGADLSEPFPIAGDAQLPAGAVVVIDEAHPGSLKISEKEYDTRVAGVVSGAGGITPGIKLSQKSMLADGQYVALSGRVYAMASTENGPIVPGDLLTTSGTMGHLMRASDVTRAHGAIVGKAMSELDIESGLVLVLISLQ